MPILTSGSTVKVDDNLEIVCLRPTDSLKEIVALPLDKRFARANIIISPISYRDAHVIESRNRHCAQNILGYRDFRSTVTHPAPAIALKSSSVIHVSQWFNNAARATLISWYCPNVHSSTMAGFPVCSNRLGVIQGWARRRWQKRRK
jgi:hypothetical protein